MKYLAYKSLFVICLTLLFSIITSFGQQVQFSAFQVKSSTLFEDLLKYKAENPKATPTELAAQANGILQKKGLNFIFAFDQNVCQQVLDAQQKQKDKSQPVKLNATLNSVDAEVAKIILPDISFDKSECGRCFIQMPLMEFSGKDFITPVEARNIKFHTPSNFLFNEIALVSEKNLSTAIRKWQVPFRTSPVGISDDGKLLYLELPHTELNELTLIIYDNGAIQFYPKKELDLSAKSSELKDISKESVLPNTAFVKFTKGEKSQVLKYNTDCQ